MMARKTDHEEEQASDESPGFFLSDPAKPYSLRGGKKGNGNKASAAPGKTSRQDKQKRQGIRRVIGKALDEARPEAVKQVAEVANAGGFKAVLELAKGRRKLEPVS